MIYKRICFKEIVKSKSPLICTFHVRDRDRNGKVDIVAKCLKISELRSTREGEGRVELR